MLNSLLREAQDFVDRYRWGAGGAQWEDDLSAGPERRITIVGGPRSGKKTLCNSLWGWQVFDDSHLHDGFHDFGLFTVAALPQDTLDADSLLFRLEHTDLVVYLLDGTVGLSVDDFRWIAKLRSLKVALLVALNKADCLAEADLTRRQHDIEGRLSMRVLPLQALNPRDVHERFLPVLLKTCPQLAVPLASEIAGLRHSVAHSLVRHTATISWLVSLDGAPLMDVSTLTGLQMQLVKRLAAVYGEQGGSFDREMALTSAFGLGLRYLAETVGRFAPALSQVVTASLGAAGTWLLGRALLLYHDWQRRPRSNAIQPVQEPAPQPARAPVTEFVFDEPAAAEVRG